MIPKDKAETILAEIRQQIEAGNTDSIAFSTQTIMWMAEGLVEAIEAAEKARQEKAAAIREISAQKEKTLAEMKALKEDYFKLMQDFRKAETSGIALESKDKLLKKWRGDDG